MITAPAPRQASTAVLGTAEEERGMTAGRTPGGVWCADEHSSWSPKNAEDLMPFRRVRPRDMRYESRARIDQTREAYGGTGPLEGTQVWLAGPGLYSGMRERLCGIPGTVVDYGASEVYLRVCVYTTNRTCIVCMYLVAALTQESRASFQEL